MHIDSNPHQGYAVEVDLCNLLQSMTLSKGKSKVGRQPVLRPYFPSADTPWRKVLEPETTRSVLYASQSASEHDADTEDSVYRVGRLPSAICVNVHR